MMALAATGAPGQIGRCSISANLLASVSISDETVSPVFRQMNFTTPMPRILELEDVGTTPRWGRASCGPDYRCRNANYGGITDHRHAIVYFGVLGLPAASQASPANTRKKHTAPAAGHSMVTTPVVSPHREP